MTGRPVLLPMLAADLDVVARLAAEVFPNPWSRQEFEKELQRDYAVARVLRPSLGEPVCAFANYWYLHDEIQLMNVATLPAFRRRGYAAALLADLVARATEQGAAVVTLEVRRGNAAAFALYRRFGFSVLGVRPRYYADNQEDAVVMQLRLPVRSG